MPTNSPFQRPLLRWYDRCRRDLPWRADPPNPYHVLVSEVMLQQTQVATVVPYFHRFMEKFPTISDLADASEQSVLRLWQGLGYYSRARNLHAAAKKVVADHAGVVPDDAKTLLILPGIGRYTAGAIASIAYGKQEPILDGNVARVLCRLNGIEADPRERKTVHELWRLAENLVPAKRPGDFNSAMMELGATVCTPRNPLCELCPIRKACNAFATGRQSQIPPPRQKAPTPLEKRWTYAIRRGNQWLIEQRPTTGRWAGLWQFVTTMPKQPLIFPVTNLRKIGQIKHVLTHRRYVFTAFACDAIDYELHQCDQPRRWATLRQLQQYPMSNPQLKIADLLKELSV